jgi:molybdenum cofactor cytidylyltransferase
VAATRVRVVVLAAGAGTRFGGDKLTARLRGRPVLQHVLDVLAAAGVEDPVVVVPPSRLDHADIEWRQADRVVNPDPSRGLSSSVAVGWAAAFEPRHPADGADAVMIVLGDQPAVDPGLIRTMLEAPLDAERPVIAPRYADGGRNPVRVEPSAGALIEQLEGDRGLGPLLEAHPDLVRVLEQHGANPDIDRPSDLEALERLGLPADQSA